MAQAAGKGKAPPEPRNPDRKTRKNIRGKMLTQEDSAKADQENFQR